MKFKKMHNTDHLHSDLLNKYLAGGKKSDGSNANERQEIVNYLQPFLKQNGISIKTTPEQDKKLLRENQHILDQLWVQFKNRIDNIPSDKEFDIYRDVIHAYYRDKKRES